MREAGADDVVALAALCFHWRVHERGEGGLDEPAFTDALRLLMMEHGSTHVLFLLALRDGGPTGMAWLAFVDRVPGPGRLVYVQSVYVVEELRNRASVVSSWPSFSTMRGASAWTMWRSIRATPRSRSIDAWDSPRPIASSNCELEAKIASVEAQRPLRNGTLPELVSRRAA